jgi:hypothetical protein
MSFLNAIASVLTAPVSGLITSGNTEQRYARQHNMNLVEGVKSWLLYYDGQLVSTYPTAKDATDAILHIVLSHKSAK